MQHHPDQATAAVTPTTEDMLRIWRADRRGRVLGPLSGVRFYPEWRPDAAFLADDIGAADSA